MSMPLILHEDDPELLREAIQFTAAQTGFTPRLIEKDYFCGVVLKHLAASGTGVIFKGGTCLSKIYGGFYRLSEDLDFTLHTPLGSSRAERSRRVDPIRAVVDALPAHVPGFRAVASLTGANNSTQYSAVVGYESLLDGHVEHVSIEISVREPHLTDAHYGSAKTALQNPLNGKPLVAEYAVWCLYLSGGDGRENSRCTLPPGNRGT